MNELTNDELKLIIDIVERIDYGKEIKTPGAQELLIKIESYLFCRCKDNGGHEMGWLSGMVMGGIDIIGCLKCGFMPSVHHDHSNVIIQENSTDD